MKCSFKYKGKEFSTKQELVDYINKGYGITSVSNEIKPGVKELFEQNPELTNAVYEAAGFNKNLGNAKVISKTTAKEILNSFEGGMRENFKNLINKLLEIPAFAERTINYIERPVGNSMGFYDSLNDFLGLDVLSKGETNAAQSRVIIEEVIHSLTSRPFKISKGLMPGTLSKVEKEFVNNISNLRKEVLRQRPQNENDYYGLSSDEEFVARAFVDERFQEYLSRIEVERTNVFSKIIEFVKQLLGSYVTVKDNSALQEVLGLTEDFISKRQITPQQKQEAQQLYSLYLDTIFPDSKVKDIVYHGSHKRFDKFAKGNIKTQYSELLSGFYFSNQKAVANAYTESKEISIINSLSNIKSAIDKNGEYYEYLKGSSDDLSIRSFKDIMIGVLRFEGFKEEELKKADSDLSNLRNLDKYTEWFGSEALSMSYVTSQYLSKKEEVSVLMALLLQDSSIIDDIISKHSNIDIPTIYTTILNIKKPDIKVNEKESPVVISNFDLSVQDGSDGVIFQNIREMPTSTNNSLLRKVNYEDKREDSYVVFGTEQIHILGNKQDIQGFKEFVQGKSFDRELAQKIQDKLQKLYPEIKLNITNNPVWEQGDNVFNQEEFNNQVNYRLKATEKILDNLAKIKQWESNKSINQETLWKKIGELGISKQQLDLLKESEGNTIEEKLTSFAANYSYAVEINTAKEKIERIKNFDIPYFELDGNTYAEAFGMYTKDDGKTRISYNEYQKALKRYNELTNESKPTRHYSNLTVPGGTNYTENEIATPAITPSIKGHAQFATDKGIGWFRSDDKTVDELKGNWIKSESELPNEFTYSGERYFKQDGEWQTKSKFIEDIETVIWRYNMSLGNERIQNKPEAKTRRILEIQSDLFQKGREHKKLTGEDERIGDNLDDLLGTTGKKQFDSKGNQFLQLLNKDNNWVTFFIKSIIQDSAKKGYEKVLFPSGETAAKVEGHQTIADEINTKNRVINQLKINKEVQQDVLDSLDINTENFINGKNKYFVSINTVYTGIGNDAKLTITSEGKEEYNISTLKDKDWKSGSKEEFALIVKNHIKKEYTAKIKDLNRRIEQLEKEKQELKSQGIEKLKPIEGFYEIRVRNILEKIYGKENIKLITDEYGNTWREITINQARDLAEVLLQRNEANKIIGQANIKALSVLIDAVNQKQDTLPHEYAHHYIAWYRNSPIVQEAIKKWGSEEALVQSIGEQVVKQKGEAYNWWNNFVKWIMNKFNSLSKLQKEELTQILTDAFLTRQDLGKQDIEGFKEFVNKNNNQKEEQKKKDENTTTRNSNIENTKKFLSKETLNTFIDNIRTAFPNIQIKETFTSDPDNMYPGKIAFIKEGVIYINMDRVQKDTPLHEISHIFLLAIKDSNIELYRDIINSTKEFMDSNPDIIERIREINPNMNGEEFLEEVAATLMGWSSEEKVMLGLHKIKVNNVEQRTKGIYGSIKNVLTKFWDFIKSVFKGIYGTEINIDFTKGSVFDIGEQLYNAIQNRKIVSEVSSSTINRLMKINRIKVLSQNASVNKTAGTLRSKLSMTVNNFKFDNAEKEVKINMIVTYVKMYGHLPMKWVGRSERIENTSENYIRSYISDNGILDKNKETIIEEHQSNFANFINIEKGSVDSIESLGTNMVNGEKVNIYKPAAIIKFLKAVDYYKGMQLMTLKEAKEKIPSLKSLDTYFDDSDIMVMLENVSKDRSQTIISLYDIRNSSPKYTNESVKIESILKVYGIDSEKKAKQLGMSMNNTHGDISSVIMGLMAADIINKTGIKVRNIASIGIMPTETLCTFHDIKSVLMNLKGMAKVEEFTADLPDTIKKYFTEDIGNNSWANNIYIDFNKVIDSIANDYDYYKDGTDPFFEIKNIADNQSESPDVLMKLYSLALKRLESKNYLSTEEQYIQSILKDSINALMIVNPLAFQWNIKSSFDLIKKFATSIVNINDDIIQDYAYIAGNGLYKSVVSVNKKMKLAEPHWTNLKKLGMATNSTLGQKENYERMMCYREIKNGGKVYKAKLSRIHFTGDEGYYIDENGTKKYYKDQRQRLSKEILDEGRWIVDQITEQMVTMLEHQITIENRNYNPQTENPYTKDEIKEMLFNEYHYEEGMLPIMNITSLELLNKGGLKNVFNAAKNNLYKAGNINTIFTEDLISENQQTNELFAKYYNQLCNKNENIRLFHLGLKFDAYANNGKGGYTLIDSKKNENLSQNIELLMKYFWMSSERKRILDIEVLPYQNALLSQLQIAKDNKDENTNDLIEFIRSWSQRAVSNIVNKQSIKVAGKNIAPAIITLANTVSNIVLTVNQNVGIQSGLINTLKAISQGFANREDKELWNDKDYLKAQSWIVAHKSFAIELYRATGMMDEYELMTYQIYKKTGKELFDQTITQAGNFWTDFGTKCSIMVAQMMHDGVFDAFTYNSKDGTVKYNWLKDKRWIGMNKSPDKKALFDAYRNELIKKGSSDENNKGIDIPYIYDEVQKLKYFGTMIIGGYSNPDRVNLGNLFIGNLFTKMKNYIFTAYQDAFQSKGYTKRGGKLRVIKQKDGSYQSRIEKMIVEGYNITFLRHIQEMYKTKSLKQWSKMEPFERANYRKLGMRVAAMIAMYIVYNILVNLKRNPDDDDKPIPENRLVRNWIYAADSILVLPQLLEIAKNPFSTISIIDRWGANVFSSSMWNKIKEGDIDERMFVPSQIKDVVEPIYPEIKETNKN